MSGAPNSSPQGEQAPPTSPPPAALAIWLVLAAVLLASAFATFAPIVANGGSWGVWPETWRYADSGQPLLLTADGYFFLSQAETSIVGSRPPALSLLTKALAGLLSASPSSVAFYLPLIFAMGLGLTALAWCRLAGAGLGSAILAALATALIPAWVDRAGPGMFDTDMAIALFWQVELLALVLTLRPSLSLWRRGLSLGLALASWLLLAWFWKPGFILGLGGLGVWILFCLPSSRFWSYKIRAGLSLLAAAWGLSILLLPPALAPAPTAVADYVSDHFALAFGLKADIFYTAIDELKPMSPVKWLQYLGGTIGGGLVILAAAGALFISRPHSAGSSLRLPLALGLICLAAGLRSNRFAYLGAFALALSLGLLPHILPQLAARLRRPGLTAIARPLGFALALALLASCGYWAYHRELEPRWQKGDDQLALALRQAAPPEAKLWNWWDDGYFLAARSGLAPFFDGGTQTSTRAYIVAHSLLIEDRQAAARWIRFFALRGQAGLDPLIKAWGPDEAWNKLEYLLNLKDPRQAEAADLSRLPGGADWLLPAGRVFFFLPQSLTRLSSWWTAVGAARVPDPALVRRHIEAIPQTDFKYIPQTRDLYLAQSLLDRGYRNFGEVRNTGLSPLAPPWPQAGPPYLVFSDKNSYYAYIVDQWGLKSLPVALLTPGGVELENFMPVALDYKWGGVWEVLP